MEQRGEGLGGVGRGLFHSRKEENRGREGGMRKGKEMEGERDNADESRRASEGKGDRKRGSRG